MVFETKLHAVIFGCVVGTGREYVIYFSKECNVTDNTPTSTIGVRQ